MLLLEHRSQRKPYSIRTEGFNCRQVPKPILRLSSADVLGVWYSGGNLFFLLFFPFFFYLFIYFLFSYLFSIFYISTYSYSNHFRSLAKLNINSAYRKTKTSHRNQLFGKLQRLSDSLSRCFPIIIFTFYFYLNWAPCAGIPSIFDRR